MSAPRLSLVRALVQRLRTIIHMRVPKRSDRRLYALQQWAARDTERLDATVAGVQTLRDLGEITQGEALYILDGLLDDRMTWLEDEETELDDHGEEVARLALGSTDDHELALAMISHEQLMAGLQFYRAHGEMTSRNSSSTTARRTTPCAPRGRSRSTSTSWSTIRRKHGSTRAARSW